MDARRPTRPGPSLLFRRLRALTLLAILVALVNAGVHVARGGPVETAVAPAPVPVVAAPAPPPLTPAQAVDATVRRWHADHGGQLALEVTDLTSGTSAAYGATAHPFATASVVKVDILATLLLQQHGELSTHQRGLAAAMIRQSSNGAATALWRAIGKKKGLDAANVRLGLTRTAGGTRGRWGATSTTTTDQLRLLRVVFTADSPLDASSRRYLTSLMGQVAPDQGWGVPAAATGGRPYVKNGWLPRAGGWSVNSVGSVQRGGHTLLMVALSDGGRTEKQGIAAVELVAAHAAQDVTGV